MKWPFLLVPLLIARTATAAEPFARVSIEDQGQTVAGQQIHVLVDVFAPDFFTSPPQFPLFELPDALVTLPDDRAQNMVRTIDGVEYAGIRRAYAVVPERAGRFAIPPIDIELGYSVDGHPTAAAVVTPTIGFTVGGADGNGRVAFAAKGLTLDQSFDRDPASLKKGDALVRTVVIFAEDTQAMLIPALATGAPDGLRQYVKPSIIRDGVQVGRTSGSSRTETIVYTADAQGSFELPALSYRWFDVDQHSERTATLAAVKVAVAAAPQVARIDPELEQQKPAAAKRGRLGVLIIPGAVLFAGVAWWLRRPLAWMLSRPGRYLHAVRTSRRVRLQRIKAIIRVGDDAAIYAGLNDWANSLGFRSITDWLESRSSPRLRAQVDILQRRLFRSTEVELDRGALTDLVDARDRKHGRAPSSKLPELNPGFNRDAGPG